MSYFFRRVSRIILGIVFFSCLFVFKGGADVIYLKNGRDIPGLIKSEDKEGVELDLGFGTVKLMHDEIEHIERSTPEEARLIRQQWEEKRQLEVKLEKKKEPAQKEIRFQETKAGIVVNALLNKKVEASLVLDTGAFIVLLSPRLGRELGLETSGGIQKKVIMADGSEADARLVVLDSVDVQGAEALNVEAAVLLSEGMQHDGLLGRSFLNKFNYQIDAANRKLILKKQEAKNVWEKARYFNVSYPSDWEKRSEGERFLIFGPILTEESEFYRPYVSIEKETDEGALNFARGIRDGYNLWRTSGDLKNKMSSWLKEIFLKSNPGLKFISSDFKERKDTIILYLTYIFTKYNARVYSVNIISKDEPLESFTLEYFCPDKYFNKYLPVFNKCLETFTITK